LNHCEISPGWLEGAKSSDEKIREPHLEKVFNFNILYIRIYILKPHWAPKHLSLLQHPCLYKIPLQFHVFTKSSSSISRKLII
jgi:hypothetical protein